MDAARVQTRFDVLEFLSQSARVDYYDLGDRTIKQNSTALKSYIFEIHEELAAQSNFWPKSFQVQPTKDNSIWLITAKPNVVLFAERIDRRLVALHTIERTKNVERVTARMSAGASPGADKLWMPSSYLLEQLGGTLTGFRMAQEALPPSGRDQEMTTSGSSKEQEGDEDANEYIDDDNGSRLASVASRFAYEDLRGILQSELFKHRKAIDWISFKNVPDREEWIASRVFSNGKISSQSTTAEAHVGLVHQIALGYSERLTSMENHYWIRWASTDRGFIRLGEPVSVDLIDCEINDLEGFAETVFSGTSSFRLLGTPTRRSSKRIDIEAIDLQTGDPVSFEMTRHWIRVYLREGSCSNVIFRFVWNFQRYVTSSVEVVSGSGRREFWEGHLESRGASVPKPYDWILPADTSLALPVQAPRA